MQSQRDNRATQELMKSVKLHLTKVGLTQRELANRMNVGEARISQILSGRKNPSLAVVHQLLGCLGLELSVDVQDTEISGSEHAVSSVDEDHRHVGSPGRKPGRPPGSGAIDDSQGLMRMAELILRNSLSERKAAARVAAEDPGHSEKSTASRLRRKFREQRDNLIRIVRRRSGLTRRASGANHLGPHRRSQEGRLGRTTTSEFLADHRSLYPIDPTHLSLLDQQEAFEEATAPAFAGGKQIESARTIPTIQPEVREMIERYADVQKSKDLIGRRLRASIDLAAYELRKSSKPFP